VTTSAGFRPSAFLYFFSCKTLIPAFSTLLREVLERTSYLTEIETSPFHRQPRKSILPIGTPE